MGSLTLSGVLRCALVVAGVGVAAAPACTVFLDSESIQCRTPEDCKKKGPLFDNYACSNQGVCVPSTVVAPPDGGPQGEVCTTTEQCTAANADRPSICLKAANSNSRCLNLVTDHCKIPADGNNPPSWQKEAAIYMASFHGSSYPQAELNERARWETNSMEMFVKAINFDVQGLPSPVGQLARRPIILLQCDSSVDAFRHAAETVGVPVAFAGNEQIAVDFYSNFGAKKKIFTLCPSCYSDIRALMPAEVTAADKSLAYTVRPHYGFQASRMAQVVKELEAKVLAEQSISKVKVVNAVNLFIGTKAFPGQLEAEFISNVKINNVSLQENIDQGNYLQETYDDTTKTTLALTDVLKPAVDRITLTHKPQIVILSGLFEQVELIQTIESSWQGAYRPYYVVNFAAWGQKLVTALGPSPYNLRNRVVGVRPKLVPDELSELISFQSAYGAVPAYATTSPPAEAYAYDGAFGVAAAIVAAGPQSGGIIIGDAVTTGIGKITDADANPAKAKDVKTWQTFLAGGNNVNLNGISSSLDWDKTKGAVPSEAVPFCVQSGDPPELAVGPTTGAFTCP